ncbi:MAG: PLP-dependent aminotransferase family protein, partial [Oscillospiraceae bacterium]
MLTYNLEDRNCSIYYYLYECIKSDIETGKIEADVKLPSKRTLAEHLKISVVTVQNSYAQLLSEGYIYTKERSGYYAAFIQNKPNSKPVQNKLEQHEKADNYKINFCQNTAQPDTFPFSVWSRQMREVLNENRELLLSKMSNKGLFALQKSISDFLYRFRGMRILPCQIIIGAGTEYLYSLLVKLLGNDMTYAVEDPGYKKIAYIYKMEQAKCAYIPIDKDGLRIKELEESHADIVHISPNHHFPSGRVMPITRRRELLSWAQNLDNRFIIEDDYDSEFRFVGKAIPTLQSIDNGQNVIYMNTFSKTISPAIRISYMVLPMPLLQKYDMKLNGYSCTVSSFEQLTLAKFIENGFFERHINRMRKSYKQKRDILIFEIKSALGNRAQIEEEHSGLHFILRVNSKLSDEELVKKAAKSGIKISTLGEYCFKSPVPPGRIIINYSALPMEELKPAAAALA